jgi:ATP-binding cassette subfamily F protein 3
METWIKKNKAKDSKATQAKDRQKKLDRMEKIAAPNTSSSNIKFKFDVKSMYKDLISVENMSIGYNEALAKNINFTLHGGNKIAIIGPNGSGKTTLLNILMKKMKPIDGILRYHHSLRMAYFDQNQMNLNEKNTVFDEIHQSNLLMEQLEVRSLLARFLFKGEDVFKEVNVLSGGEKVRLSFAKLSQLKHDLMVLDEPTNHLDIDSKEVLFEALNDYDGTMMFISHDRHLIDEIATHILYFKDGEFRFIEGNYQDYLKEIQTEVSETKKVSKPEVKTKKISNNRRNQVESRINEIEERIDYINQSMFDEEVYSDHEKVGNLSEEKEVLELELLELYEEIFE